MQSDRNLDGSSIMIYFYSKRNTSIRIVIELNLLSAQSASSQSHSRFAIFLHLFSSMSKWNWHGHKILLSLFNSCKFSLISFKSNRLSMSKFLLKIVSIRRSTNNDFSLHSSQVRSFFFGIDESLQQDYLRWCMKNKNTTMHLNNLQSFI